MNFKNEFQRYKKAVDDDVKELEIVITWLEMTADANVSGVPKAEIAKLVSFYKENIINMQTLKNTGIHTKTVTKFQ